MQEKFGYVIDWKNVLMFGFTRIRNLSLICQAPTNL